MVRDYSAWHQARIGTWNRENLIWWGSFYHKISLISDAFFLCVCKDHGKIGIRQKIVIFSYKHSNTLKNIPNQHSFRFPLPGCQNREESKPKVLRPRSYWIEPKIFKGEILGVRAIWKRECGSNATYYGAMVVSTNSWVIVFCPNENTG